MNAGRESVTVRVPGSTSNCGAGFDTLGLALAIYNQVTLTRRDSAPERERSTARAQPAPDDCAASGRAYVAERPSDERAIELVAIAAEKFFHTAGIPPLGFRFRIEGEIPLARGLGSSATIVLGVIAGLDALHGTGWSRERLAALGTAIEGNPENICAGLFGGFTVSRCALTAADYLDTIRVAVPAEWRFIVASPAIEMPTKESRGVLPATLPLADAARSVNSAAFLTAAIMTGDFEKLRHAVGDFLHEPYRLPRILGARAAIEAGVASGAITGWLSGSGSSVLCVARSAQASAIGEAMRGAFARAGVACTVRELSADNAGLRLA